MEHRSKLIEALRQSAKALETETIYYEWTEPACCSCGVLFCALLDISEHALEMRLPTRIGHAGTNWTTTVGQHCTVTGKPVHELFQQLMAFGLTAQDIVQLEYLENPRVLARMDLQAPGKPESPVDRSWWRRVLSWVGRVASVTTKPDVVSAPPALKPDRDKPMHVAAYMRVWANLLEEEDLARPASAGSAAEAVE